MLNSSMNKDYDKGYKIGYSIGAVAATVGILFAQAWVSLIIFSWFGLALNIWQCLLMILLVKSITSIGNKTT